MTPLTNRIRYNLFLLCISIQLIFNANSIYPNPYYLLVSQDTSQLKHPVESLEPAMNNYNMKGYASFQKGNFEEAASNYTEAVKLAESFYSETDIELASYYMNLGTTYLSLWDYQLTLELFDKAEAIYRRIEADHPAIGNVYLNKGIVYKGLRNFDKAITFYNQAIYIFKNDYPINYYKLYISYRNLSLLYLQIDEYSIAIELNEQCIRYDKDALDSRFLHYKAFNARVHCLLGNISLAEKYYLDALSLGRRIQKDNPEFSTSEILMDYGVFLMDYKKDYDNARKLFSQSHDNFIIDYGEKSTVSAICYQNIGELFYHLANIDSSLQYFQKSLMSEISEFDNSDIYVNPEISIENQKTRILNTLKWKAKILITKYDQDKNLKNLKFSLETYLLIYDFIDQMRLKYDSETSNFLVSKQEDETFLSGIGVAYKLYQNTKDPHYLEVAFMISEKRKSFTLLTSIRKLEAKEFGGIPPVLLKREKDLHNRLAAYEESILEENRKRFPDQIKVESWKEERFRILSKYDQLVKTFESEYPDYYRLKYDASTYSIEQIQGELNNDQVIINYDLTENALYTFIISKEVKKVFNIQLDSSDRINLEDLRSNVSEPNFSENALSNYLDFCNNAHSLYNLLIDTLKNELRNKSLLIIPDGSLWYIPFEILLSSYISDSTVDYRNLPYLIREYPVSYAYSATLHFEANQRKSKPGKELLAFAPSYSSLLAKNQDILPDISQFLEQYREHLVPIPGAKEEVKMINRIVNGDVYIDEEATESRFKQDAENYDILHLAMHTIVNNEDPMYSKLAFAQNVDSLNDGFLNTYEIYNMRFNARMAVLSSCKTGFGKLMKGEGVMSLARGFMYAGCPSIVMTLWEVSDKSGARLMQDFYQSLIKGKSKAEALQEAKLNFLKKADNLKANPYFWSTYVVIGDSSPIYEKSRNYLYWLGGLILAAGIFLIVMRRYQQTKRHRNSDYQPDTMYS